MINVIKNYFAELCESISSKKKVIKIIGLICIPLIYAFICITAFWNPLAKLSNIPTAIVSLDNKAFIYQNNIGVLENTKYIVGHSSQQTIHADEDWGLIVSSNLPEETDNISQWIQQHEGEYFFSQSDYDKHTDDHQDVSGWRINTSDVDKYKYASVVDWVMNEWKNGRLEDLGCFYNQEKDKYIMQVDESTKISMDYITGDNAKKICSYNRELSKWTVEDSKYYMHVDFPQIFSAQAYKAIDTLNVDYITDHVILNLFVAYQKNYLCGEILDIGSNFAGSVFLTTLLGQTFDSKNIFNNYIPNKDFGVYGVGIGQLFMCVGMFVGAISMINLFKRKRKTIGISARKGFCSKVMFTCTFSFLQATILMFCLGIIGFFGLGVSFIYQWFLLIFAGVIFNCIVLGLWYSFKAQNFCSICLILFLVLNIACGWGTFPSILQNNFFNFISYLVPFTYLIHAQGAIIFGIGGNFDILTNSLYILQMVGITCIFGIIFFILGWVNSIKRGREEYFGSSNAKNILQAVKETKFKVDEPLNKENLWNKLPNRPCEELISYCKSNFDKEKSFSWYTKLIK